MRALFPLVVLASLSACPAVAQVLGDPKQIGELLARNGLTVHRGDDIEGTPVLESSIDDTRFNVYFYECHPLCDRMQFVSGFTLPAPMALQRANEWNRSNPYATVVVSDSGDAFLEMDIGLAGDGIGRKNFYEALQSWRLAINEFRDYLDW
jgi:hypothetical protein